MLWDEDPFEELMKLRREMDKVFNRFFERSEIKQLSESGKKLAKPFRFVSEPLSDVKETSKDVVVRLDMPGVDKKDIQLNISENSLEVKAERREESKVKKRGFFREERSLKSYHRVVPLPASVKAENAKAEYNNGVLEVKIPKKKIGKKKGRRIMVK